jgi:isoleucyl-tRNA synthetase
LLGVRATVHKGIEALCATKALGSSLQAKVVLKGGGNERIILESLREHLPEIFLVSQVDLAPGNGSLEAAVDKADGVKCARCWRWQKDVGGDSSHPELCARCVRQLKSA